MAHIGLIIRKRRDELGLTQEELAKILGYKSKSTINKIEMGINDVSQSKIVAFANALKTTPSYLMGLDNEKSSSDNTISSLDNESKTLLAYYNKLNRLGQQKLTDYAEDLKDNPKYCKDTPSRTVPLLKAAHARTDIEIPAGADKWDEDIMNDENF